MELEQVWSLRRSEKPENGDRNSEAPHNGDIGKVADSCSLNYFLFARRLHESEEKSKYRKQSSSELLLFLGQNPEQQVQFLLSPPDPKSRKRYFVAHLAEHLTCNQRVVGSIPIENFMLFQFSRILFASIAQLAEHYTFNVGVASSNLTGRTKCFRSSVGLEHLTLNQRVVGSSPTGSTITNRNG